MATLSARLLALPSFANFVRPHCFDGKKSCAAPALRHGGGLRARAAAGRGLPSCPRPDGCTIRGGVRIAKSWPN